MYVYVYIYVPMIIFGLETANSLGADLNDF